MKKEKILKLLTLIIFKCRVGGVKAAAEPELEFSSTPKEYVISSPGRCEHLSEPHNSEPIAPLSVCILFLQKKKGREVQKGHFWGTKGTSYFTYPHTMHTLKPKAFPILCSWVWSNLGLKCVFTTGRQLAEFGWPCCVRASCCWLRSFLWTLMKGMRATLALNLHQIQTTVTGVWFRLLT